MAAGNAARLICQVQNQHSGTQSASLANHNPTEPDMADGKNDPSKSGEDFDPISPLPGDNAKAPTPPGPNPGQANNPSKSNSSEPMGGEPNGIE